MSKKPLIIGGLSAAALIAAVVLFSGNEGKASSGRQLEEGPEAPARAEVVQQPTEEVQVAPEAETPPASAKKHISCTDYKRPEDVPWEHFFSKPLKLRPGEVKEDGTLVYYDYPMLVHGKRVFGTMEAKPTEPLPLLPGEIPGAQKDDRGAKKRGARNK